jgi:hypothetical protein
VWAGRRQTDDLSATIDPSPPEIENVSVRYARQLWKRLRSMSRSTTTAYFKTSATSSQVEKLCAADVEDLLRDLSRRVVRTLAILP